MVHSTIDAGVQSGATLELTRPFLQVATIERFSEMWRETSTEADILHTLSCAGEFSNIKVRVTLSVVLSLHHGVCMQAARANLL